MNFFCVGIVVSLGFVSVGGLSVILGFIDVLLVCGDEDGVILFWYVFLVCYC